MTDVVIIEAVRTPIGAYRGALATVRPDDLAAHVLHVLVERTGIDAGQIGDWMAPMTMPYSVKPDSELKKLHVGDRIEATVVVVSDTSYYVTDVKVVKP